MAKFDFITGEDFRLSLESDYTELNAAMQSKSWKAAHVLAGSIIEAILIDYLIASDYQKKHSVDPLKMDLSDAITACKRENILSTKTEQLSHVIRSYRNLIHPGRAYRLGETADEHGAKIAQALVEIIVNEITSRRKENYGYTAEQIVSKIENDSAAIAIVRHLLKETNEHEIERLLLNIIPNRYYELFSAITISNITSTNITLKTLVTCYRNAFDKSSTKIQEKVAKSFVKAIKEEVSEIEWRYLFFRGKDLEHYAQDDRIVIKEHFMSLLIKHPLKINALTSIEGLGAFFSEKEATSFLLACVNSLAMGTSYNEEEREKLLTVFQEEYQKMSLSNTTSVSRDLKALYTNYHDSEKVASSVKELFDEINPFEDIEDSYKLPDLDDHPF